MNEKKFILTARECLQHQKNQMKIQKSQINDKIKLIEAQS